MGNVKVRGSEGAPVAHRERGSALILALILIVVLTFVGFGLITRSLLVSRIAGSERWSTKAFYAADAGINAAKQRLRIREYGAFTMQVADLRGSTGSDTYGPESDIDVQVSAMVQTASPVAAIGSQVGGGQGTSVESMLISFHKATSTAAQGFTRSERVVSSTMTFGPAPVTIPQ